MGHLNPPKENPKPFINHQPVQYIKARLITKPIRHFQYRKQERMVIPQVQRLTESQRMQL